MRNRPGCQRHTSGRAEERGRGAGSAAQGWDQPGTPTSRTSASRTPRLGMSASCTPGLRTRHPSAALCPRSRHPRHARAPLDPSAPRHPGTSHPPTGCASSPRSCLRLSTFCFPSRRSRSPAHARTPSRAAPAMRPGAATAVPELARFVWSLRSSSLSLERRR